jgi:hypothetical protein
MRPVATKISGLPRHWSALIACCITGERNHLQSATHSLPFFSDRLRLKGPFVFRLARISALQRGQNEAVDAAEVRSTSRIP